MKRKSCRLIEFSRHAAGLVSDIAKRNLRLKKR
jgi:hypothetical protein